MSTPAPQRKVAVIGSGIAGLAGAIRLAAQGLAVDVFEAEHTVGGKISEQHVDGFRFDRGPSVLTMPQYIDDLFRLAGEDPAAHIRYERLDPVFHYFFADGSRFQSHADRERFITALSELTVTRPEELRTFFHRAARKLELTDPVFLQRSLHRLRNYTDRATFRGLFHLGALQAFTTMDRANRRLLRDPRTVALFNQYASYNGSDPFQAPATLNLIAHYELGLGAYYPVGGMYRIAAELHGLAERLGVRFHLGTPVERILTERRRVTGIRVGGADLPYTAVLANADVHHVFRILLPDVKGPRLVLDRPRSSSVVVFFWGMEGTSPELGLHNLFLSGDQRDEYEHLFRAKNIGADPSVYVYISSKKNPADAPPGMENWFVMISVPPLSERTDSEADMDKLRARAREAAITKLSRLLGRDVSAAIRVERTMDPRTIAQRTRSAFGSVYGYSSNGMLSAFLRHANFSRRVKGLYLSGGSVHPGPSIPLSLLSAKIASGMVVEAVGK